MCLRSVRWAGALINGIPNSDLGGHIIKFGTLRIQRRWVENSLPNYELLDAVAIAYGKIAEIVQDAHRRIGRDPPVTINVETGEQYGSGRAGRLPCISTQMKLEVLTFLFQMGCASSCSSVRSI